MDNQNTQVEEPNKKKRHRKKLIIGAVIASFLLIGIVFGSMTNFMGKFTPKLSQTSKINEKSVSNIVVDNSVNKFDRTTSYDDNLNYIDLAEGSMNLAGDYRTSAGSAYREAVGLVPGIQSGSIQAYLSQAETAATNAEDAAAAAQSYADVLNSYVTGSFGSVKVAEVKAELDEAQTALDSLSISLSSAEIFEASTKSTYDAALEDYASAEKAFYKKYDYYDIWDADIHDEGLADECLDDSSSTTCGMCYYIPDGEEYAWGTQDDTCEARLGNYIQTLQDMSPAYDAWWDNFINLSRIQLEIVSAEAAVAELEIEYAKYDVGSAQEYADQALLYAVKARDYASDIADLSNDSTKSSKK